MKVITTVRSMSDSRRRYKLTLTKVGKIRCSCPAWSYHYRGLCDCKHIRLWKETNGDNWQALVKAIATKMVADRS